MRSTQLFAVFAVLATSVSSMSIGHASNQMAHRRHAAGVQDSVIQARGARRLVPVEDPSDVVKRDAAPRRRKRGINQRRCAPKTTTGLAQTTSVASTSSAAPTTTSTPEPEPTTSQAEPTTSSKAKQQYTKTSTKTSQTPTKTSTSAKPTATSDDDDSGSSSGETFTGQGTFYGTGLGSCGITSKDTDYIVAVSHLLYDGFNGYTGGDPNNNPICGKKIKANYEGKSVTVTVVDRCTGCALRDLDFSPTAFDQLADQALGRLSGVTWNFV